MVANVFFVIIPGQKKMVAAAERGEAPDPAPGVRAKQRSVHNTYFTLPVLFVMTSNHFAMVYGHAYNWLILIGVSLAGALIRVYFVNLHKGSASAWPIAVAAFILSAIAFAIAPQPKEPNDTDVSFDQVRNIIDARCTSCHSSAPSHSSFPVAPLGICHSSAPSHPSFPVAPLGIAFDNDEQIVNDADRIYQQTVLTRVMPIGNLTAMTDEERQVIDAWYQELKKATLRR
jgi:uncharacterized membrane protein